MPKGPLVHIQPRAALGEMKCSCCQRDVTVRANSGGQAYAYCNRTDGGCGHSPQCRDDKSTVWMVHQIREWRDGKRDMCEEVLAMTPPAMPTPLKPEPTPELKPAPAPVAKKEPPTPDIDPNPEPDFEPEPEPVAADSDDDGMWWD